MILYTQITVKHPDHPSFPTRRSSDLSTSEPPSSSGAVTRSGRWRRDAASAVFSATRYSHVSGDDAPLNDGDRKSTRLNSSHVEISYAVFCLKKKKKCNESLTICLLDY